MSDLIAALQQVIESGQPAHAARARELVAALSAGPGEPGSPPETTAAAHELLDAYLHDPYLTRNP